MSYRKFKDHAGRGWEVRPASRRRWHFEPVRGNPEGKRIATAPGHTDDPFELSEKELQRMLEGALPRLEETRRAEDLFKD